MNTELNQNQPKTQVKGIIFLLITAIVWGTSFVSQSVGSEVVRPFTFMGIRTLLGSFVLMPVIFVRDKIQEKSLSPSEIAHKKIKDRRTVVIGLLIGIALCFATNFQQFAFN
ncbi:MAG: DMT family transporter, partial [Spirochaetia bacterium]|nr:DMT family transporter [Spirochaetia bacterium]